MRNYTQYRVAGRKRNERGSMLIELMIAMVVLAIGLGGIMVLLVSSLYTNNKAGKDTTSTMLAEHVLEQVSAQPADGTASLTITDCASTAWTINTIGAPLGGGSGLNGGNGANLTTNGIIDWTQDYASVPAGYAMQYVACGAGGRQITYDVRWDIITTYPPATFSRMIVTSARPANSADVGGMKFIVPVNLRTIGGM